jgi:hypothetical protein
MQFIFPLAVGLGSYLFVTSAFVALSPTAGEHAAYASAQQPEPTAPTAPTTSTARTAPTATA